MDSVTKNRVNRPNYYTLYPREKITDLFKSVCDAIHKELDNAQDEDIQKVLESINNDNPETELATDGIHQRITRIKPSVS